MGDVRVFGSVVRGDNTGASDVDLLIKTRPGCSLFDLGGLLEDFRDRLQAILDAITQIESEQAKGKGAFAASPPRFVRLI